MQLIGIIAFFSVLIATSPGFAQTHPGEKAAEGEVNSLYGHLEADKKGRAHFNQLKQRAETGDPEAMAQLGNMYFNGDANVRGSYDKAIRWWEKAVAAGNGEAAYRLSFMYMAGIGGVEQDEEKVVELLEKAAQSGNREAQLMLGAMYSAGQGAPRDTTRGYRWLKAAAAQGDQQAVDALPELKKSMTDKELREVERMEKEAATPYYKR